jgi:hypothetical protein
VKSLFTVHAGEVLVGSEIEQRFRGAELWLPAKDTGVDVLVTNPTHGRMVTLMILARLLITHMKSIYQEGLLACGWWTIAKKILASKATCGCLSFRHLIRKRTHVLIPPGPPSSTFRDSGSADRVHSICGSQRRVSVVRLAACRSETTFDRQPRVESRTRLLISTPGSSSGAP